MTAEEAAGPPGPKVLRLLIFAGAGFLFTIGINKWREIERKQAQQQQGGPRIGEILSLENGFVNKDVNEKNNQKLTDSTAITFSGIWPHLKLRVCNCSPITGPGNLPGPATKPGSFRLDLSINQSVKEGRDG
ncbi:hypothetical protein GQ457_13G004360 [Hibiscus cannabinus]